MRTVLLLAILSLFSVTALNGQSLSDVDSALTRYSSISPQEKVFVQTDKTYYFPGETIWMKAWCTIDGVPTYLSRILYVDLVNSNGEVVQKKMYRLDSLGSTPCDIEIITSISTGTYAINAYTLWMLNNPEFIFRKEIFVYGRNYQPAGSKEPQIPKPSLQFFPEGGDMIIGLKSRIAYKATSGITAPLNVKGYITDNTGTRVAAFESVHNGMGVFELQPEAGKSYTANIEVGNGSTLTFKLPPAKTQGLTLRVENNNTHKLFVLVDRGSLAKENYDLIKIVAQVNHQLVYEAHLNLDKDQNAIAINKQGIPPGIIQVTAFDRNNRPLAERLSFIENYEIVSPILEKKMLNNTSRGENTFTFGLPAGYHSIAASVTNALLDNNSRIENTIASSLLLTSDLKGYIHQPGYYFRNKDEITLRHLDLLLMTHGWRRFKWERILNNEVAPPKFPVESTMWIAGKATKTDRTDPITDGKVSFVIKGEDSTTILAEAILSKKGEFLLGDLSFRKKATVSYKGTNNVHEQLPVDVILIPSYIDTLRKSLNIPRINLDTVSIENQKTFSSYWQSRKTAIDTSETSYLETVTVAARVVSKEDSLNNVYASGLFHGGKAIDPAKYPFYNNPWQILMAAVPGVNVEYGPNPLLPAVSIRGGEPLYFLNEIEVDQEIFSSVSLQDIALIKVLKSEATALGAFSGAILIYTRKGGVSEERGVNEQQYISIQKEGYAVTRQFYVPESPDIPPGKDHRMTLYWNANPTYDKTGLFKISFRNDDISKAFKIVIQGISDKGNIIFYEKIID
jgi:hypothetical protein